MKLNIWIILFIMLVIFVILDCIDVELNIDDTTWSERKTNRIIHVYEYDPDIGVRYRYAEDNFDKYMHLIDLLIKFKYGE